MGWKKITVEWREKMTDEQQIFHLTLHPHEDWNSEPKDWASMTRAKRTVLHHRLHMQNREKAVNGTERLMGHDHKDRSY